MGKSKARKPTLAQKQVMTAAGLAARNWLVLGETDTNLLIVSKASGQFRTIRKLPSDIKNYHYHCSRLRRFKSMGLKVIFEDAETKIGGYGTLDDLLQAYTCITHTVNMLLTGRFEIDKVKATAAVTETVNMPAEKFEAKIEEVAEMPDEFREVTAP